MTTRPLFPNMLTRDSFKSDVNRLKDWVTQHDNSVKNPKQPVRFTIDNKHTPEFNIYRNANLEKKIRKDYGQI